MTLQEVLKELEVLALGISLKDVKALAKRNIDLHQAAIEVAEKILALDTQAAKWIAKDALRQLAKPNVNILDYPRSMYRKDLLECP